jgi:7-keto-8-aminopelargonate synthetase-like enzyme
MEKYRHRFPTPDLETLNEEELTFSLHQASNRGIEELKELLAGGSQALNLFSHSPVWWPRKFATSTPKEVVSGFDEISWRYFSGVNFATQDYMSLCGNKGSIKAATDAIREFGTHSGNTPHNFGYNKYTNDAKLAIEEYFNCLYNGKAYAHIFSAGWLSGYGALCGNFYGC